MYEVIFSKGDGHQNLNVRILYFIRHTMTYGEGLGWVVFSPTVTTYISHYETSISGQFRSFTVTGLNVRLIM